MVGTQESDDVFCVLYVSSWTREKNGYSL